MIARYQAPSLRRLAVFGLAALALAAVALTEAPVGAAATPTDEEMTPDEQAATMETLAAIRNGGTAMFAWLTDQFSEAPAEAGAETEGEGIGETKPTELDWNDCPAITYDELHDMLVPTYINTLARTDAWGHELEFCLAQEDLYRPRMVVGIRSSGRDGVFQDSVYPVGPFGVNDQDRDIVWIDGFFVTWPQAQS